LPVGTNCFRWTTDNGGCGVGTTFDEVCINVYSENQPAADAGEDQDLCTPISSTIMDGSEVIAPAIGVWTQISGPSAATIVGINDPSTSITNLTAVGCYTFVWQIDNGSCTNPLSTDTVQICIFDSGFPPADAGVDQELCSPNATTQLNAEPAEAPGIGTWTADPTNPAAVSFSNINDPNATITGLIIGTYHFTWSLDYSSCGSEADDVTVTVFNSAQGESQAGDDIALCTPTSTATLDADPVLPPGFGTWSVISGNVDIVSPNSPNSAVLNIQQGVNVLVWTVYNGDCLAQDLTTDTMVIYLNDFNQPAADAGLDQSFCTPTSSVTLVGNALSSGATGLWTTTSGAVIDAPTSSTSSITGLTVGISTFCWTIDNGACNPPSTQDCVDIYIYDITQPEANAGADQDLCSNLATCANLDANELIFPAVGTWNIISGNTLTFTNEHDPNTQVCGLAPGVYTLEWCIDNGPCGAVTCDQLVITIYDETAESSNVGEDIELCTPNQSATMNANVVPLPGFGIWEVVSGAGDIQDWDNPQTEITNIPIGESQFSWCISNGVCPDANSCDTISVFVFDEDAQIADAGPDQDWCAPNECVTMAALPPTIPGVGTWVSLAPGPIITDANDPNTEICNLGVGEYYFLWTVYNGPCAVTNTNDLVRVRIFSGTQPEADAGEDLSICTPQNIVTLNANNVTFPGMGIWNPLPGANGTVVSIDNPDSQVINLVPDEDGASCFTWTINNGPCVPSVSTDTMCVYIFDTNTPEADAGEDQAFCAPMDLSPISTTINGSVVNGASEGEWSQDSGPTFAIFANPNSPTTEVSNLLVGCYEFRWTVINGPCGTSSDVMQICIFNPNEPPAEAGDNVEYCTPVECHAMNATTPVFPATGMWNPITQGLCYTDLSNSIETFCCMGPGINTFIWTVDNGPCLVSSDVMVVVIYNEFNPAANAGPDMEICLPTISMNPAADLPFLPAIGQWDWVSGPCPESVIITDANSPNSLITGLCEGTSCFTWTVDNGPCPIGTTVDTMCVRVFDPNTVVTAGDDQSVCTPNVDVVMNGNIPEDPNYGTWSILTGGGTIIDPSSPTTAIEDLPVGINSFIWEIYNGACENGQPSDTVNVSVYDQSQPPAICCDDIELCFPETQTTMCANPAITPALGYWTFISGAGTIQDIFDPNSLVTGLATGDNVFVWTIDNGPCENAITTDTLVIHVFPVSPQTANAGPDFEICTPESDVTLAAVTPLAPAYGYWVINSLNGILVNSSDANSDVLSLTVGMHTLTWNVYNGPCADESTDVMDIYVYDAFAPVADAGADIELCFPLDSAQMAGSVITFPGTGLWMLGDHPGNPVIESPNANNTWVHDLEIGITELIWQFDNGDCGITTDTMLIRVYDPVAANAAAGPDQFFCDIPESIDLVGNEPTYPGYGWWEQIAGDSICVIADSSSATTTATNIPLNETAFVWHIYNGSCANSISTDTVWFYVYDSEVSEAYAGNDTSFCGEQDLYALDGSELVGTVNGLANGIWTSVDDNSGNILEPNNPNTVVEDIPVGIHCYVWSVSNGACGSSADTVCVTIYDTQQQPADAGGSEDYCNDEFTTLILDANEAIAPATGYWSVIEGEIIISDSTQHNSTVTSLGTISVPLVNEENWIAWTIDNGVCGATTDSVLFVLLDCETILIPDAFSPNSDGTNDVFFIPNLQYYPNNNIKIFNRWGALVYSSAPYKNDWDGTDTNSGALGTELPSATYYYVLDLGEVYEQEQRSVFTGYVYLKR
jgi:gliding motility-associated-like protein